jgi:hypothetical protein
MDEIASAIRAGRLSLAFLEAAPYRRWAVRSTRTYRQVSQETGVPLLQLGASTGILAHLAWLTRLGRAYAEGLRLAANVENEAYRARFTGPVRASGADQRLEVFAPHVPDGRAVSSRV